VAFFHFNRPGVIFAYPALLDQRGRDGFDPDELMSAEGRI
jgi:hypothetical protein